VPCSPDWDEAYLAAIAEDEYPGDADLYEDPDNAPPAGLDDAEMATLIAEARENAEERARADADAAARGMTGLLAMIGSVGAGRRGPGVPGSVGSYPGEYVGRGAGLLGTAGYRTGLLPWARSSRIWSGR
jgi:hypothetical protein